MTNEKISKFEAYTDEAQNKNVDFGESEDTSKLVGFSSANRRFSSANYVAYLNQTLRQASYNEEARRLSLSSAAGSIILDDVYVDRNIPFSTNGTNRLYAKVGSRFTYDSSTGIYYGVGTDRNTVKIENWYSAEKSITVDLRDHGKYININEIDARSSFSSFEFYADTGSELIGGQGKNSFNVSKQVGDVQIISQKASDEVNFYDCRIDDISNVSITPTGYGSSASETISVTFATGKTVAITGAAEHINFADSSYVYSRSSRTLTQTA